MLNLKLIPLTYRHEFFYNFEYVNQLFRITSLRSFVNILTIEDHAFSNQRNGNNGLDINLSLYIILPLEGLLIRHNPLINVDLPEPLGPNTTTKSLRWIVAVRFLIIIFFP
uniref:Uncharacterized protein n=1 Tax=Ureaplasma urealyticum TaxID=2130 RepID=Q56556_UREUR|nr:unknown [Ureaplasma urealyticum]